MAKVPVKAVNTDKKKNVLKFNMETDDAIRRSARRGYEVSKIFKEAGFKFRKVYPAHTDESTKKLFKLGPTGPNLCLEISLEGRTETQQKELIDEIKDQFLMLPSFTLVNDKSYKLDRSNLVHRFLFKASKIEDDK